MTDIASDAASCGLGLMYVPNPVNALQEDAPHAQTGRTRRRRHMGRPSQVRLGREVFPITDARVASDVCPMFFYLGTGDMLAA